MTDDETRVTCTPCAHLKASRCTQAKRAGLSPWASIEIGSELAQKPQHCPAYKPRGKDGR